MQFIIANTFNFILQQLNYLVSSRYSHFCKLFVFSGKTSTEVKQFNFLCICYYFRTHNNIISEKSINELSSLLKDEDIHNDNNKVIKYDQKTDSNVIF